MTILDRAVGGPVPERTHLREFRPVGEAECEVVEQLRWDTGRRAGGTGEPDKFWRKIEREVEYRSAILRMDLETHPLPSSERPVTIAVSGVTGLVGTALAALLRANGHEVRGISRRPSAEIVWAPEAGRIDADAFEGIDAVIHLAGEPIAQRWTATARKRILESRREGTSFLAETILKCKRRPACFVSISGINAYGATREERLTEEAEPGNGFLAEVCSEWEAASLPVEEAGIRRVIARSGMVLSPAGGALAMQLPIFRLGLGGSIGRGRRWTSWIAIDDIAAVLATAVLDESWRGIINATAPEPVRNREYTRTLASALHRPAIFPVPPLALKAGFGRMAEETILGDLRVEPARLRELGYRFRFPDIRAAWKHLLP